MCGREGARHEHVGKHFGSGYELENVDEPAILRIYMRQIAGKPFNDTDEIAQTSSTGIHLYNGECMILYDYGTLHNHDRKLFGIYKITWLVAFEVIAALGGLLQYLVIVACLSSGGNDTGSHV